jgi:hypothetical protein
MTALDREIIRLLMYQVREEQRARQSLTRALLREEGAPVLIPTDAEIDARISELEEAAIKNLTNRGNKSSI